MKRRSTVLLALFFFAFYEISLANSFNDSIFSAPFHMDARLLVFKGKMNGREVNFAFDTGAAQGLAGSNIQEKGAISKKGKKLTMQDANKNKKKVRTAITEIVELGPLEIRNVSSLLVDMPYLVCHDYYLLGSNLIRQLNWQIDFENKMIYASKSPFPVDESWQSFDVIYRNNRPYLDFSFDSLEYQNILVDFGFAGTVDLDNKKSIVQDFLKQKNIEAKDNPSISMSVGAISQQIAPAFTIIIDSLKIGNHVYTQIPLNFEYPTTEKIGVSFFSTLTSQTVINNSESTYYLKLKNEIPSFRAPNHLSFSFEKGKFLISGKSLGLSPEDALIEIGEEVALVNGISSMDFEDNCQFIRWYYGLNFDQVTITKLNGQEVIFTRIPLN